jgi:hypothetical protein
MILFLNRQLQRLNHRIGLFILLNVKTNLFMLGLLQILKKESKIIIQGKVVTTPNTEILLSSYYMKNIMTAVP